MKLRHLLLGRKAMTRLHSEFKKRYHFANKGPYSQSYAFSSSHVGCESWTIKKAQHWRIDAFELWCWRTRFRVPWTARSSNQSILKEISPKYSLKRLILKLKLQYFDHLMGRADSLEMTLMLGKIKGRRKRGRQMRRWLDVITKLNGHDFEQTLRVGDGQRSLACCSPQTEQLNNNTRERPKKTEQLARITKSFPFHTVFSKRLKRVLGSGLGLEREGRRFTWRWKNKWSVDSC